MVVLSKLTLVFTIRYAGNWLVTCMKRIQLVFDSDYYYRYLVLFAILFLFPGQATVLTNMLLSYLILSSLHLVDRRL